MNYHRNYYQYFIRGSTTMQTDISHNFISGIRCSSAAPVCISMYVDFFPDGRSQYDIEVAV